MIFGFIDQKCSIFAFWKGDIVDDGTAICCVFYGLCLRK